MYGSEFGSSERITINASKAEADADAKTDAKASTETKTQAETETETFQIVTKLMLLNCHFFAHVLVAGSGRLAGCLLSKGPTGRVAAAIAAD